MPLQTAKPSAHAIKAATIAFVLSLGSGPGQAQESPFESLRGSWSGGGTITATGGRERIRCRATYTPGERGTTLRMSLRCASDSYKFELESNLRQSGGQLSGTWSELSRKIDGSISGTTSASTINATALSPGFSAFLTVSTRGTSQSVSIQSPGSEISQVSISLARR
jgi:hypothetical protein